MATRIAAGLMLLMLSSAASASDAGFSGVWSRNVQLCDRDHACTPQELQDPDTRPDACSSTFTLVHSESRLCGTWDSGCSFTQGSSGVLTGKARKRSAEIKVGESTAFHADRVFPVQDFIRQRAELRRDQLHVSHVDRNGVQHAEEIFGRIPGMKPSLVNDQDFLAQCQAGVDFELD
jgi:hypothetical protein